MRPGRAADHSPTSSAAVMEQQSYTCTHPLGHTGPVTGSLFLLDEVGGQRHAPAALHPGKRLGTLCVGGWVGPRAGLDGFGKSRSHRDAIPRPSSP